MSNSKGVALAKARNLWLIESAPASASCLVEYVSAPSAELIQPPMYCAIMPARMHPEALALIEESHEHIRRVYVLMEDARLQARLAMKLINESRRFMEEIEELEARRILLQRENSN